MVTAAGTTFTAGWYGIGANFLLINLNGSPDLDGSAPNFHVDWGDGQSDNVDPTDDTDGNGVPDQARPAHGYGSDGTYLITASSVQSGTRPVHLEAFAYSNATNDLTINATSHYDHMIMGGSGNDTFTGNGASDWFGGGGGNDTLVGGGSFDFLLGGMGDDIVKGGGGDDLLTGDEGSDQLYGGAGGDSMYGGDGDDFLSGGDGNDYLDGQTGRDTLVGGDGSDTFTYDLLVSSTKVDRGVIRDFTSGQDHINLTPSHDSFSFIGQGAFDGLGPEVRYVYSNATQVQVDTDGNGTADFTFRLPGQVALSDSDFYFQSPPVASDAAAMGTNAAEPQASAADVHQAFATAYSSGAEAHHMGYGFALA